MREPSSTRLQGVLLLASISLIGYQLVLMQILSYAQWHHFAYLVVSLALLGFGASGALLALFRDRLQAGFALLVPLLLCGCALTMTIAVAAGQHLAGGFDSYLLFVDPAQILLLAATGICLFVPFLLGALPIILIFDRYVERVGRLYAANLLGSGLGGLSAVALMWLLRPEQLPAAAALPALVAGLLVWPGERPVPAGCASIVAAGAILLGLFAPPPLVLSEYKGLRRALDVPGAEIVAARPSPYGLVQAVAAPGLRSAPGMSLTFPGSIPVTPALFSSGDSFGAVVPWPAYPDPAPADYSGAALPFALGARSDVLVLGAGSGRSVAQALAHGARRVVAVEPHRAATGILDAQSGRPLSAIYQDPRVELVGVEPRTHLAVDPASYDLVILPDLGTFGGGIGLAAVKEEYLLTVEALVATWRHLGPRGVLRVTAWQDYPVRAPLKLLATLTAMLRGAGVDPGAHIAAVRGWNTITFVVTRAPLATEGIAAVREFAERLQFDPLLLPGLRTVERERFHLLQERGLFRAVDAIMDGDADTLFAEYPFDIRPVHDGRPFFTQYFRWQSLPQLTDLFGRRALPFFEMGYLLVLASLLLVTGAAVLFILLPLARLGWRGGDRLRTVFYFSGLGLGYMFVEMVLIHQFVLYLGHPIYAAAAVIAAVLIFSGIGSLLSERFAPAPRRASLTVAGLLLVFAFALPTLLEATMAAPLPVKVALTGLIIAPPALAMGFPFPAGLRLLGRRSPAQVPWAWGINGCLSVVASALATLTAVELGFSAVLGAAAGFYGLAALSGVGKQGLPPPD